MNTKATKTKLYIQLTLVAAALLALYLPYLKTMASDWNQNDNYGHGYFIPFIAGFMIYFMRKELKETEVVPETWGLLVIAAGLCQLIIAKIGSEYFLQRTSLIIVLFGIVLFFWGRRITAKVAIPLLYLIFMVPIPAIIWNRIAFPMQLFASGITEQVISLIGIPIFREGNILHLPETTLEVVDACSGLRSLITMFALSGAFAFFIEMSRPKKVILFLSAIPIAILINVIRLVSTAVMSKWVGVGAAQGFLHESSGILVFILGLLLLFVVHWLLQRGAKLPKV